MKRYALHVPADLEIATAVRTIATQIFGKLGFSAVVSSRLKLVFDEIFMNAVKYGSVEGSSLHIIFEFKDNTLEVCFEDEGGKKEFTADDLKKIIAREKSNTDPTKKSGRGLAQIAEEWTDDLKIWDGSKGGICIAFKKKLSDTEDNTSESSSSPKKSADPKKKSPEEIKKLPSKVIVVSGEVDNTNLPEKTKEIDEFLQELKKPHLLIVDLAALEFCNSSFIAKVVTWHEQMRQKNGGLVIQNIPANILEIFELVGISKLVTMTDSEFQQEE